MGQPLAAEIGVAGVRMGVDMDHAERPLGAERAQDRVGDDVVAADFNLIFFQFYNLCFIF